MDRDTSDWISRLSNILGFWTIVAITTCLVLCWRRISYVYHLRDARSRRIESIQDKLRSLRDLNSSLDGANSQALHSCILEQEQDLDKLSQTKDSLWSRFFAFFRADPCLRLLEELEEDLKQRVQRMTDVRLMIPSAHNARQPDATRLTFRGPNGTRTPLHVAPSCSTSIAQAFDPDNTDDWPCVGLAEDLKLQDPKGAGSLYEKEEAILPDFSRTTSLECICDKGSWLCQRPRLWDHLQSLDPLSALAQMEYIIM